MAIGTTGLRPVLVDCLGGGEMNLHEALMQGALAAARQNLVAGSSNWTAFMADYINEATANDPTALWRDQGFQEWRRNRGENTDS
jgi:hypothetical protein